MAQYQPIRSTESSFESTREKPTPWERPSRSRRSFLLSVPFWVSFSINIALTFYLLAQPAASPIQQDGEGRSRFAGLVRDTPKQWTMNVPGSEAEWADLWDNKTSYDPGVIALDDDYARGQDLPRAQRWPWDDTKGIYLLNGYHNLHCIKNLRSSLEEFKEGREQSIPWPHVQHCLLVMRDEIMCNADDTPRYSGYQDRHHSGYGQWRMCRDWSKLEAWAMEKERSGCWKHIPGEEGVDGFQVLDRYRFCPEGSKYKEMSETMWRGDEDHRESASVVNYR